MLVFQSEAQLFTKERLLNNENFDKPHYLMAIIWALIFMILILITTKT